MSLPPGPPLPSALQTYLWIKKPTQLMHFCARRYGKSYTLSLPQFSVMLTSCRDAVRTIFAAKPDDMHAGRFNVILRPLVGPSSVLLLDGPEHIQRRKMLMPSFQGSRMRVYGQLMADIARRAVDAWPRDEPFSLHPHTQDMTLQIILRTVFGMDEGASLTVLHDQMARTLSRVEKPMAFVPLLYLAQRPQAERNALFRWLLSDRDKIDRLLYEQIAARRRADPQGRIDVLSMLLLARDELGQGLTDSELRDELMTALAAGHETTATSLAWAVERILCYPEVYARLRDEVRALGPEPDPARLAALPYLEATLKEVLRLRPVVPLVGRVLRKPYTLAGYDLPAGTPVGASIYMVHRDPEVYPEPEVFRPERFLDAQPDSASWFPFGGGTRRCIGAAFAMYEMKIVLGTMLARCDLELAQAGPSRIIRRAVTFWPEHGTRIRVRHAA